MKDYTRLFDIIRYQNAKHPQAKCLGHYVGKEWVFYSSQEIIDLANNVSLGLLKLGIEPGDKIALISYKNRPEWNIMDIGMLQIGVINVPVYPTISPGEYEYIFNDAGVKACFVSLDGKGDLLKKVQAIQDKVPTLKHIYTFDKTNAAPHWESILEGGDLSKVEKLMDNVQPNDLATIIYTSGTTGFPKGVMLSHDNIVSNVRSVVPLVPLKAGDTALSFLPLCHIFERTVIYTYTALGISTYYTGTDNLGGDKGDLKAVKPNFFTTVPRLLEKVYEKIYNKGLELKGIKRRLFFWALSLTDDFEYDKKYSGLAALQRTIADKLIFSKWREALGGNIKGILTGAAACPTKMAKVFSAAGIPIREGYGLTETSPALCIGRYEPNGAMMGTIGPAIEGITLKIDASDGTYREGEGEILAKGPNIMMGYYNKPDQTAEVIDKDGWFHTGDVGTLVQGKKYQFLKITDRKKELLKTSGGKYVAPAPIEGKLREEFLIEQVMVVGEKQKFVSALIVPAPEALKDWCNSNGIDCPIKPFEANPTLFSIAPETLRNEKVREKFQQIIAAHNPSFSHIEQIKKFELVSEPWDVATGELTPTMKLKRRVILEKFAKEIDKMYS
jgi:long-chain acyl-CoA synthetase